MAKQKLILATLVVVLTAFAQLSFAQTNPPFPQAVINEMATRKMRYHHYLWHNVRDRWNSFSTSTKTAFRNIGWAPDRPSRTSGGSVILDNKSGEDFLYMHREMIANANAIIAQTNDPYGPLKGWPSIPAPGDKDYPVPATYTVTGDSSATSSSNTRKTNSFYTNSILPNEKIFTDPVQLRRMSLGELGARIEVTVHNYIHMRFSSKCDYGYRSGSSGTIPNVDKKWDDARYNWLGDTYSAHVHPWFWKIHGWVDDRIEDWKRANNVTTINWVGTWTGGPTTSLPGMSSSSSSSGTRSSSSSITVGGGKNGGVIKGPTIGMGMGDDDEVGDIMLQAFEILAQSGIKESSFADEVTVAPWKMVEEPVTPVKPVIPVIPYRPRN